MRQSDEVRSITFTLPPGYKFTTVEQGLRDAVNHEWACKVELLKELHYQEGKVKRLTLIGDKMAEMIGDHAWTMQWNAEKNL